MLKRIFKILTGAAFCIVITVAGIATLLFLFGRGLPEYGYLKTYEPPVLSRLYAADGQLLSEYAVEKRLFLPFHLIPDLVKSAFLAAEDKNFYYHFGVDVISTLRALIVNTLTSEWEHRPGGASTITQQVAKNFLVGNERSFSRKIKEAIMAFRLEQVLSKERIFELYLNQIYLGAGAYGVAAAALLYFNKELDELTIEEVAFLASLPKAPTALTNSHELSRTLQRRNWVIQRMSSLGIISPEQEKRAKEQPLHFRRNREYPVIAPYFSTEVHRELLHQFDETTVHTGGLTVKTTLDPELQQLADQALQQGLLAYERRHPWRGPLKKLTEEEFPEWLNVLKKIPRLPGMKQWQFAIVLNCEPHKVEIGIESGETGTLNAPSLEWIKPYPLEKGAVILVSKAQEGEYELQQLPLITGAIVVMDPHTGRILAISGGYNFEMNQFNCATQAKRQPGSAFKPFVYLAALEKGFTLETKILDAPLQLSLGKGQGIYAPQNYTRRYYGMCSLRVGLEQSRNVMTIRLAQHVRMNKIRQIAKDFGLYEAMPGQLAMVLGAGETTVLNLTAAYGMIANGGYELQPRFIDSVQDRYGNTLLDSTTIKKGKKLVKTQSIQDLTSMLRGVVERGTAKRLQQLGFPVAGKTGTTNNYKDAWFVGFTDDLVIGVFVGFAVPRSLGEKETGSRVAVPIFETFVREVYKNRPLPTFQEAEEPEELIEEEKTTYEWQEVKMSF